MILPRDDLRVSEKKQLAGDINVRDHEMDALAAARYAYKQFEDLFRRVEKNVPNGEWGNVKKKLVLDEASNIKAARQIKAVVLRQEKRLKKRTGENELAELKKENVILRKKLQALESRPERTKIIRVGDKVAETRLMTIKHKEQEINELKKQVSLLEARIGIYAMGGVPVGDEIVIAGKRICVDEDVIKGLDIRTKDGIQFIMRAELEKVATRKIVEDIMSEYRS